MFNQATNTAQILPNQATNICRHEQFNILNIFNEVLLLQDDQKAEDSKYLIANLRECDIWKQYAA